MHKIDVGWGFAPDPTGGAYSAPPDPLTGFKGPTFKGGEGKGRGMRRGEGRAGEWDGVVEGKKGSGSKEGEGAGKGHPWFLIRNPG